MAENYCAICGQYVDKTLDQYDPMSAQVDHIIPISKGGHPSDIANLQLTHRVCNLKKSDKLYMDKKNLAEENKKENALRWSQNWIDYRCV
ncbi:MAG: HNH endonuclease [Bacteroidaceae bacterium]|nr:HNH endonuclease [Bacteroidaceae bacterium]